MTAQIDLFPDAPASPPVPGLRLVPDAISLAIEKSLIARIDAAPLEPFRFGQWTGKRLTAYYGSAYDFQRGRTSPAPPLPEWLLDLRERLAPQLGLSPQALQQALLIRYDPGAGIGWHRDRPQYDTVVGLSLGAPATLRLRRRRGENGFERRAVPLAPRAAYLLADEVRDEWEHSITPMDQPRWSITFRSLR
ncbi:alpha-ketoglutarate-dependent dioxygenase AlkB [Aurantiacibacter hainanensis]|uniref:alpha-ketoglutarate-dependent dioxygenase AlkB n=1 Tax=Aurantiacibacter hainanensis TaxID=3076114 RepID=UPI0030C76C46